MPIEENHDFLDQKQEHPKYPKRERLPEKSEEKLAEEKPEEKKKKKGDDQMSLF